MVRHKVDLEQLDSVITRLEQFEGFLDEQLNALDHSARKLHGTWQGDAATAHQRAHDKLMAAAREIHEGIKDMRQAAQNAHYNYNTAIRANVRRWRGEAS
ncbi:WXG100 family type VII secretion target [Nocardia alni]|uniref:WXG100 family type VII secretion target n=1 Tax=Nocardia alni TaxID=2815723 RepID=UPI001C21C1ED|nr:WXG100 family type VII secretion target [Nocardia alni]